MPLFPETKASTSDIRTIILAPTGKDKFLIAGLLERCGKACHVSNSVLELRAESTPEPVPPSSRRKPSPAMASPSFFRSSSCKPRGPTSPSSSSPSADRSPRKASACANCVVPSATSFYSSAPFAPRRCSPPSKSLSADASASIRFAIRCCSTLAPRKRCAVPKSLPSPAASPPASPTRSTTLSKPSPTCSFSSAPVPIHIRRRSISRKPTTNSPASPKLPTDPPLLSRAQPPH